MGFLKVTAEDLETRSQNLATGSQSIQEQLGQLQGQIQPLVDGGWQGAASDRFHQLWDEWQRSAVGLRESLDGISTLLGSAGRAYTETEQQIASSIGGN